MEQNQYRMYVDGNTVRKAEALPKDDRQERIRREREEQRARNRKIAKEKSGKRTAYEPQICGIFGSCSKVLPVWYVQHMCIYRQILPPE